MNTDNKIKIVVVEDDLYYNRILSKYIESLCQSGRYPGLKFQIKSYLTAEDCLRDLDRDMNIMILDYYLTREDVPNALTGEDVLQEVKKHAPDCKVIMCSSQRNLIRISRLLDKGIYDYVDKNVNTGNRIGKLIHRIIQNDKNA